MKSALGMSPDEMSQVQCLLQNKTSKRELIGEEEKWGLNLFCHRQTVQSIN